MSTKKVGDEAESIASKYLISQGYDIIERNYRTRFGEIDIIAKDNRYIVFVEVKYRSNDIYGQGYEYVDSHKIQKLVKAIKDWMVNNSSIKAELQPRIDVISVDKNDKITHLINAVESID